MENAEKIETLFYTPAEAAQILRISLTGMYRHLRQGTIKSKRVGKILLIPKEYIAELAKV